jgi:hypothetical protein
MNEKIIPVIVAILVSIGVGGVVLFEILDSTEDTLTTTTSETVTYTEDFQPPDINASDPSESWYVYSEDAGIAWMNVTNQTTGPLPDATNQTYNLTSDSSCTGGALYSFVTETTYDSVEVYAMVDSNNHNYTIITIGSYITGYDISGHGAIAYWNVTNDTCYFYVLTGAGPTYTEVYNHSISSGTWYRLRATFDYDTYAIASTLQGVTVGGTLTSLSSGSQTCVYEYTNITRSYWAMTDGEGSANCSIWMDDFELTDTIVSNTNAGDVNDNLRDMSTDIFGMMPLIALVLVAVIIISIVVSMGSNKRF